MFQNMLLNSLVTPLRDTDETSGWVNRPFQMACPQLQKSYKGEVTRTIKKKPKRIRTAFTTDQVRGLEKAFIRTRYIDPQTRKEIASQLNIGEKSVKIWFQNRRMKEKKDSESSCDSSTESFTESSKSDMNFEMKTEVEGEIIFQTKDTVSNQPNYIQSADPSNINRNYDLYGNTPNFYNTHASMYHNQAQNYNYPQYCPYYAPNTVAPNNTDFFFDNNVYPSEYYPVSQHNTTYQTPHAQWEYNCADITNFYLGN